ncbi:MAG: transmembrane 220 family protein [Flavobacteriales bacterium]|nr:transmembrane 220 family protein [Flavobacteriales bacterium]
MKKAIHIALALLFAVFAYIQLNDPDPEWWFTYYAVISVLCALAATGRFVRSALIGMIIITLIWAAILVPEFVAWARMGAPTIVGSMKAEAPHIEFVREFLGLLIGLFTLLFLLRRSRPATT